LSRTEKKRISIIFPPLIENKIPSISRDLEFFAIDCLEPILKEIQKKIFFWTVFNGRDSRKFYPKKWGEKKNREKFFSQKNIPPSESLAGILNASESCVSHKE